MNKFYTTIAFLFFVTLSYCQVSNTPHKIQITNLVQDSFDELWANLNADSIEKYYTNDFLLLENGEIWNNDSIVNYIKKAKLKTPKSNRINKIEVIAIKIKEKTAWIAYQNYATISVGNEIVRKAHWLESATATLTENGWKLEMLHSTRIKNE